MGKRKARTVAAPAKAKDASTELLESHESEEILSKDKNNKKNLEMPPAEDSMQAELVIGTIGHVDHGKSTLVKALTGKFPDTHSEELRRGITIRLGYADCELRVCEGNHTKYPFFNGYTTEKTCPVDKSHGSTKLLRRISFSDCPGHEVLMATMLSGAAIMDGVLLVISATEPVPMPQTREHLAAMNIIGMKNLIVCQNKVELVSENEAEKNFSDILTFLEKEKNEGSKNVDILPISAIHKANIDVLIKELYEKIPKPQRNPNADPLMYVARSFDVNKPGTSLDRWVGGIVGGVINEGVFKIGDEIEIRPGLNLGKKWEPLKTDIISLKSGFGNIEKAYPGGLIGIGTDLDPALTKNDQLVGQMVGSPGRLPPVWITLDFKATFMERVVGTKTDREMDIKSINVNTYLMLNINTAKTVGVVTSISHHKENTNISATLKLPVCASVGSRIAISYQIEHRWRLVGYGQITGGKQID